MLRYPHPQASAVRCPDLRTRTPKVSVRVRSPCYLNRPFFPRQQVNDRTKVLATRCCCCCYCLQQLCLRGGKPDCCSQGKCHAALAKMFRKLSERMLILVQLSNRFISPRKHFQPPRDPIESRQGWPLTYCCACTAVVARSLRCLMLAAGYSLYCCVYHIVKLRGSVLHTQYFA